MTRASSFKTKAIIYLVLGALQGAISAIIMPVYSHILTVPEFGLLALLLTVEAASMILMTAETTSGAFKAYFHEESLSKTQIVSYFQRFAIQISAMIMAGLFVVLVGLSVIGIIAWADLPFFLLAVVSGWFQRVNNYSTSIYRAQGNAYAFGILAMTRIAGLSVTALALYFLLPFGLIGVVMSRVIVFGACALYEIYNTLEKKLPAMEHVAANTTVRRLFRQFSLPLFPAVLTRWAYNRGNTFIAAAALSLSNLAVFSASLTPGLVLTLSATSIQQVLEPLYFNRMSNKKRTDLGDLRSILSGYFLIQTSIAMALMALAPEIFRLLFPPQYSAAAIYSGFLVISGVLFSADGQFRTVLLERGQVSIMPAATISATTIGLSCMFLFGLKFGIGGSAFGVLFTSLLSFTFLWFFANKLHGDPAFPIIDLVIYVVLLGVLQAIVTQSSSWWLTPDTLLLRIATVAAFMAAAAGIFLAINRKGVVEVVRTYSQHA